MRVVTNVVDPAKRERLANAKRRLALHETARAAGRKAVAAAMAANRKAKCARRNGRGI